MRRKQVICMSHEEAQPIVNAIGFLRNMKGSEPNLLYHRLLVAEDLEWEFDLEDLVAAKRWFKEIRDLLTDPNDQTAIGTRNAIGNRLTRAIEAIEALEPDQEPKPEAVNQLIAVIRAGVIPEDALWALRNNPDTDPVVRDYLADKGLRNPWAQQVDRVLLDAYNKRYIDSEALHLLDDSLKNR